MTLLSLLGDRVVAYRPELARALGNPLVCLFLCQACYWQQKKGEGRWFYKLRDARRDGSGRMLPPRKEDEQSWEYELCMSRSEQQSARRILCKLGILEEKLQGIPAQLFFRVNLEKLEEFLLKNQQIAESYQQDGRTLPTSRQDTASQLVGNEPTISTQTTHRNVHITTTTSSSSSCLELIFPEQLIPAQCSEMGKVCSGLEPERVQLILDELAESMRRKVIKKTPLALFRTLVNLEREGRFVPDLAYLEQGRRKKIKEQAAAQGATRRERELAGKTPRVITPAHISVLDPFRLSPRDPSAI